VNNFAPPPTSEVKSLSRNDNSATPSDIPPAGPSLLPALTGLSAVPRRFWLFQAALLFLTVLITQFFLSSSADAARAAALAVWAQDDPARLQAVQRFEACMRDEVPGVMESRGCARHAGGAALGEAMVGVTDAALQRAMDHIPAPLAWVIR